MALPYLLKFLWAPLIDRYPLPLLDRRRGWGPGDAGRAGRCHRFVRVTKSGDLADADHCVRGGDRIFLRDAGHCVRRFGGRTCLCPRSAGLRPRPRNLGYRTAAWLASAFALIIADYMGWRQAFLLLAGIMLLFCVGTWLAPAPHYEEQAPRSLRESVLTPLRELLSGPSALVLIAVVLLFKLGDAFAMKLFTPFMMGHRVLEDANRAHRGRLCSPRARSAAPFSAVC